MVTRQRVAHKSHPLFFMSLVRSHHRRSHYSGPRAGVGCMMTVCMCVCSGYTSSSTATRREGRLPRLYMQKDAIASCEPSQVVLSSGLSTLLLCIVCSTGNVWKILLITTYPHLWMFGYHFEGHPLYIRGRRDIVFSRSGAVNKICRQHSSRSGQCFGSALQTVLVMSSA
jgi:hypothetical protein